MRRRRPFVLGLTGSIGMGKSHAAATLRRLGVPVHDADAEVHRLYAKDGAAVPLIAAAFPGVVEGGVVVRERLRRIALAEPRILQRLEAMVHPLVRQAEQRFLAQARARRVPLVVLDVPLLFETGGERRCDAVLVVSAPRRVQLGRVLRRAGITCERLAAIESRQLPDSAKRRRADFIVETGLDKRTSLRTLGRIVNMLRSGGQQEQRCARSSSTPKRRGWKRRPGTASSRSPVSSS
jgi:dephospho-CoA kinase